MEVPVSTMHPGLNAKDQPTRPSRASLRGLDWFNFFVADIQTGFGPFIAVPTAAALARQLDIWVQAQTSSGAGCDNWAAHEFFCRKSVARRSIELRIRGARIIHGEASDPPARG